MANADQPVYCLVCGEPVSRERVAQGATTCTKEHSNQRKLFLRAQKDAVSCRYCGRKKSTPQQKAAMQRFRRVEKTRPDLIYPFEFEGWLKKVKDKIKEQTIAQAVDPSNPPIVDMDSEAFMQPCREAFATWWNDPEREAEDEAVADSGETQIPCGDDKQENGDGDEKPQENWGVLAAEDEPAEVQHWYVYRGDHFHKKGELCEIMKAPSRGGVGGNVVQVKFRDGFMPVVGRGLLRTATAEQIKKMDGMVEVESTLAASGKPAGGE